MRKVIPDVQMLEILSHVGPNDTVKAIVHPPVYYYLKTHLVKLHCSSPVWPMQSKRSGLTSWKYITSALSSEMAYRKAEALEKQIVALRKRGS